MAETVYESDLTRREKRLYEKEKIRGLRGTKKLQYLWDYYRIVPVLAAVAVFLVMTAVQMYKNANRNPYLSIVVVDADPYEKGAFTDLAAAATEALDTNGAFDPIEVDTSIETVNGGESSQKLQMLLNIDPSVDAVICSEEVYRRYDEEGIFEGEAVDISQSPLWHSEYTLYSPVMFCVKKSSSHKENAALLLDYLFRS